MNISGLGISDYSNYYNTGVNRSEKAESIRAKSLEPVSFKEMSEADRAKGIQFLNDSSNVSSMMMEKKYPVDLLDVFKMAPEDKKINKATMPRANDNDEAAKIKKEYKELANEIRKDLAYAKMLVSKLGEGKHELTDKDGKKIADVKIVKDKNGDITVDVNKADGSKLKVSYNEKKPNDCRIDKTDKDGNKVSMGKGDTKCERTQGGVTESYEVNEKGGINKETKGPGEDNYKKTVVNRDGSTDNYELIYNDEDGNPVYEHTKNPAKSTKYLDASSGKAIDALNKENPDGKINANQIEKLIINATSDADGQAAGKEYQDLKKFITSNWNRLEDNAKAVWNVYENTVRACRARGLEGIPEDMYEKMKADMTAVKNAGGKEGGNPNMIAPNQPAQPSGPSQEVPATPETPVIPGSPEDDNEAEDINEAEEVNAAEETNEAEDAEDVKTAKDLQSLSKYRDKGAGKAIEALNKENPKGKINGKQIEKLIIDATKDLDNQAAGREYQDLVAFVEKNWNRLDDVAKAKWNIYENYARTAIANGETGIKSEDYKKMITEIKAVGTKK